MLDNDPVPDPGKRKLAARAVRVAEEAATALQDLAGYEPNTALALAESILRKVAEKSKAVLNAALPEITEQPPGLAPVDSAGPTNDKRDIARAADEIKSLLKPSSINQRSLLHRRLRGELFDDIVMLLLLANEGSDLVAGDIKNEFGRLQIKIGTTTLLSRIARLRDDEVLEPVSVTGTGTYRLSPEGKKVAQTALEKRWREGAGSGEGSHAA